MFTGLVEAVGRVVDCQPRGAEVRVRVHSALPTSEMVLGESVAVNGACLTVTSLGAHDFTAHVSAESVRRTNLGSLRPGDRVNLERALRLGDRLGGHVVQGHVDGCARLLSRRTEGASIIAQLQPLSPENLDFIVEKGSITLDGISLTVSALRDDSFEVTVVPWTAGETAFLDRPIGWLANLEVDILGKYVARLLSRGRAPAPGRDASSPKPTAEGVTLSLLQRTGFWSGDP
jgi:riboflavin synthase